MEISYSSVPKIQSPTSTLVIITIATLGFGLLWYYNKKGAFSEKEEK